MRRRTASAGREAMSTPPSVTRPAPGAASFRSSAARLDLPEPEAPSTSRRAPSGTSRSRPAKTGARSGRPGEMDALEADGVAGRRVGGSGGFRRLGHRRRRVRGLEQAAGGGRGGGEAGTRARQGAHRLRDGREEEHGDNGRHRERAAPRPQGPRRWPRAAPPAPAACPPRRPGPSAAPPRSGRCRASPLRVRAPRRPALRHWRPACPPRRSAGPPPPRAGDPAPSPLRRPRARRQAPGRRAAAARGASGKQASAASAGSPPSTKAAASTAASAAMAGRMARR